MENSFMSSALMKWFLQILSLQMFVVSIMVILVARSSMVLPLTVSMPKDSEEKGSFPAYIVISYANTELLLFSGATMQKRKLALKLTRSNENFISRINGQNHSTLTKTLWK